MGNTPLSYEEIKIGDELPSIQKQISSVSMVMYAASTWDFHRYHHDKDYAQSKGMKAPFLDGQQLGGYLAQQVVDWTGIDATLKRLSFRYTGFVFAGDTLSCKGKVVDKRVGEGEKVVECELWIENQRGERVLDRGRAIVVFPAKPPAVTKRPQLKHLRASAGPHPQKSGAV